VLLFFAPNFLGHPDNYIPANPLSTPAHIVPEWYFWPFYAILRAFTVDIFGIPAKLLGVVAMFGSIILLFFLPWLDNSPVRSGSYRPRFKQFFWILVADVLILGYCGGAPAEEPYVIISQLAAAYYFAHFLIILPLLAKLETTLPLPNSITDAVLGSDHAASNTNAAPSAPAH
jgi:ubiquinol-cytochrome c reductase cytochrome b subunit